jgi:hypothetical protein
VRSRIGNNTADTITNSISITGLVVLGGNTSIADPSANFRDAFAGTTSDANGLVNALVRITFSYQGYQNCFNIMNEVKVGNALLKAPRAVADMF